jgi:hypothetical protein
MDDTKIAAIVAAVLLAAMPVRAEKYSRQDDIAGAVRDAFDLLKQSHREQSERINDEARRTGPQL